MAARVALAVCGVSAVAAGGYYGPSIAHNVLYAQNREVAHRLDDEAKNLLANHESAEARIRYVQLADYLAPLAAKDAELKKLADDVATDLGRINRLAAVGTKPAVNLAPTPQAITVAVQTPNSTSPLRREKAPSPAVVAPAETGKPGAASDSSTSTATPAAAPATPDVPAAPAVPPVPVAPAGRPPIRPVAVVSTDLSDEQVGKSIQRGVDYLISSFDPKTFVLRDGIAGPGKAAQRDGYRDGADVLCVYSLRSVTPA
jgi:hypothetical protein